MKAGEGIDCPDCKGIGTTIVGVMYPTGHHEMHVDCELCEGEGAFDEEDFIMLRLAGKV